MPDVTGQSSLGFGGSLLSHIGKGCPCCLLWPGDDLETKQIEDACLRELRNLKLIMVFQYYSKQINKKKVRQTRCTIKKTLMRTCKSNCYKLERMKSGCVNPKLHVP